MERFPAQPSTAADVRTFLRQALSEDALDIEDLQAVVAAVSEAVSNALIHTNSMEIRVGCSVALDRIEAWVADEGIFRPDAPTEVGGWGGGLALAAYQMDEITIRMGTEEQPGTLVRLVKRRSIGLGSQARGKRRAS